MENAVKQVSKSQLIGWLVAILIPVVGTLIAMYSTVQRNELRIELLEKHEIETVRNSNEIRDQLRTIETSIARIETKLEYQQQNNDKKQ